MKRRIFKLVLFLLLGAIINVAVAWSCAMWSSVESGVAFDERGWFRTRTEHSWNSTRDEHGFGYSQRMSIHSQLWINGILKRPAGGKIQEPGPRDVPTVFSAEQPWRIGARAGFPVYSLTADGIPLKGGNFQTGFNLAKQFARLHSRPDRVLPVNPIWPGFAINTIFYAAIMWMLFAFPGLVRRRMRARRGRCVGCGYDLRGRATAFESNVCPECGKQTKPDLARRATESHGDNN